MTREPSKIRNVGLYEDVDSVQSALHQKILLCTQHNHRLEVVQGEGRGAATLPSDGLGGELGSVRPFAVAFGEWSRTQDFPAPGEPVHQISIVDASCHLDSSVENNRLVHVVDGALLVLCAANGLKSKSIELGRQLQHFGSACVAFIDHLDHAGANPYRVTRELRELVKQNATLMQIPIGLGDELVGVVDLVRMRAFYFESDSGAGASEGNIPAEIAAHAYEYREMLLDTASMYSDELSEAMFEEKVTPEVIKRAVRDACIQRKMTPVFMGSAKKNRAVELLLDGLCDFLPAPFEVVRSALDQNDAEQAINLTPDPQKPFVGLVFASAESQHGQLSYLRVYQGTLKTGDLIENTSSRNTLEVGRIVRIRSQALEDLGEAQGGDICVLLNTDSHAGETLRARYLP